MALVKGSKIFRVRVIEYRMRTLVIMLTVAAILVAASVWGCYYAGYSKGMAAQEHALAEVARLTSELDGSRKKAAELEQNLANLQMSAEVDKQSNEDVRQEVLNLKDEIARLTEENGFYKGLMSPKDNESGLSIGSVELANTRMPGAYSFKVVVQQLVTRHEFISGTLSISVHGHEAGLEKSYDITELSPRIDRDALKLRFKYFQVVEGEFTLPSGFEPEGFEVQARVGGRNPQSKTKKYGWLVEEN